MRAALGAARGRIVRQFLTESLLLGLAGGACGLGIAYACLAMLRHSINSNLSRAAEISLNWQVILLLIVLSIVSAVIFGTMPAIQAASADPQEALYEGSRGAGAGVKQLRLRNALIVGELALSLVLLVSAGLLLRTLYALRSVPVGFNPQHLVVAQFFSKGGFTPTAPTSTDLRAVFYDPLLARVRQIPESSPPHWSPPPLWRTTSQCTTILRSSVTPRPTNLMPERNPCRDSRGISNLGDSLAAGAFVQPGRSHRHVCRSRRQPGFRRQIFG